MDRPVAVAVSGGPDSVVLAHMLRGRPGFVALCVDHGLRPESADEARYVQQLMADWDIPCEILSWQGEKPTSNVQAQARDARYRLISAYCKAQSLDSVLLAHHRDDQAETLLLRLERGSGVDGLAAMSEVSFRSGLTVLRPMLDITKAEILAYAKTHKIDFVIDPSNKNQQYKRVQMRQMLDQVDDRALLVERLAKTAQNMQDAQEALGFLVGMARGNCVTYPHAGCCHVDMQTLKVFPRVTQHQVLAQLIQYFGRQAYTPRADALQAVLARLERGDFISQPLAGAMLVAVDGLWIGREADAMPIAVLSSELACYDQHWALAKAYAGEGLSIGPLREAGWQQLCANGLEGDYRALPHVLRHSLPAVFDDAKLLKLLPASSWQGLGRAEKAGDD